MSHGKGVRVCSKDTLSGRISLGPPDFSVEFFVTKVEGLYVNDGLPWVRWGCVKTTQGSSSSGLTPFVIGDWCQKSVRVVSLSLALSDKS